MHNIFKHEATDRTLPTVVSNTDSVEAAKWTTSIYAKWTTSIYFLYLFCNLPFQGGLLGCIELANNLVHRGLWNYFTLSKWIRTDLRNMFWCMYDI